MSKNYRSELLLSESDFKRLSHLVDISRSTATDELDNELARAEVCNDIELPETVVALYDCVHFRDLKNDRHREITIVMPWEASLMQLKISILSPVGIALIGETVGARVVWPLLNGARSELEVIEIVRRSRIA